MIESPEGYLNSKKATELYRSSKDLSLKPKSRASKLSPKHNCENCGFKETFLLSSPCKRVTQKTPNLFLNAQVILLFHDEKLPK